MLATNKIKLHPLEKEDLRLVHRWKNDLNIMSYWFEEPFESYMELEELYIKHIHDQSERRFIIENLKEEAIGLIELIEIDYIHRRAEFDIIIDPTFQGQGYGSHAIQLIQRYAFSILNLHKLYLDVVKTNTRAIRIYRKAGFQTEAELKDEYFIDGHYHNIFRMCIFKSNWSPLPLK